jgi:hypothetical protein
MKQIMQEKSGAGIIQQGREIGKAVKYAGEQMFEFLNSPQHTDDNMQYIS